MEKLSVLTPRWKSMLKSTFLMTFLTHMRSVRLASWVSTYGKNLKLRFSQKLYIWTCSLHFQWPWQLFQVTAMLNSLNQKFYVPIPLRWNYAGLTSASSRSWTCHYFWLLHVLKGDGWRFSWFDKNCMVCSFTDSVQARFVKHCIIITLLGVYQFKPSLMTLTLFQGHRCVRIMNCKLFFRVLPNVV